MDVCHHFPALSSLCPAYAFMCCVLALICSIVLILYIRLVIYDPCSCSAGYVDFLSIDI